MPGWSVEATMKKVIEELKARAEQAIAESVFAAGRGSGLTEAADLLKSIEPEEEKPAASPMTNAPATLPSTDHRREKIKRAMFDLLRASGEKLTAREIVNRLRKLGYDAAFETVHRGLTEAVHSRFIGRIDGRYFALRDEAPDE